MVTIHAHIGKEQYQARIRTATNSVIADEPLSSGGKDLGFSPSELLAASLGACTSITLRMYADRKGWDLTDVNVEVTLATDVEHNVTNLTRKIHLSGELTEEQKQRLLKVANSCPTHKILTNAIAVGTELI